MLIRRSVMKAAVIAVLAASTGSAHSQNFPIKPIRVLTSEPGGGGDIAMRMIGPDVTKGLGQPVVIDNRPLVISGEIVAKSPPDGYTMIVYGTTLWLEPLLQHTPYDPLKDFAAVTMISRSPNILVVHGSVPVSSVAELIALVKSKPGVLNYSSGNSGSTSHLGMELFKAMAGINLVRIPYKGAGPAVNALVAGETQVMLATATSVSAHVKSGRVKALAVTTAQRSALIPDLPTVSATGLPGYESASVYAMMTTGGTPVAVVERLNREVVKALSRNEIKERFLATGVEAVGSSPKELSDMIRSESTRMAKVIKDANIRVE